MRDRRLFAVKRETHMHAHFQPEPIYCALRAKHELL